jgi:PHD/YefM family antitoxin component YafN of YafNO toxin-antitoxin module
VAPNKVLSIKELRPILDFTKDIQSLTTFRRQSNQFLKQLKKSKRPVVLTVNGKAAAIAQDAKAYQRVLDIADRADEEEAIRQGLEDVKAGRTKQEGHGQRGNVSPSLKRSMAYVVNTTLHAERDLAGLYQQVNAEYSHTAMDLLKRFFV